MRKIATTLINNIKDYIDENPDMVKNVLGAGALGAGAGGLLVGGGSKYETTGQKVKRRLKNALIGGALASGAAAMLTHGSKQLATAMPAEKETPYEAMSKVPTSGAARALYATLGGGLGKSISNRLKTKGIALFANSLEKGKNTPAVADMLSRLTKATDQGIGVAGPVAQEVAENLSRTPDVLHNILGSAGGVKSYDSIKKVTDSLHAAGVNTSKMKEALPGFIPFTHIPLAKINMDNKLSRWMVSDKPVKKLVKLIGAKNTRKIMKHLPDIKNNPISLQDINMDNRVVRSILHPGTGAKLVTGLATAGAFAPEIISVVNKVRSAL